MRNYHKIIAIESEGFHAVKIEVAQVQGDRDYQEDYYINEPIFLHGKLTGQLIAVMDGHSDVKGDPHGGRVAQTLYENIVEVFTRQLENHENNYPIAIKHTVEKLTELVEHETMGSTLTLGFIPRGKHHFYGGAVGDSPIIYTSADGQPQHFRAHHLSMHPSRSEIHRAYKRVDDFRTPLIFRGNLSDEQVLAINKFVAETNKTLYHKYRYNSGSRTLTVDTNVTPEEKQKLLDIFAGQESMKNRILDFEKRSHYEYKYRKTDGRFEVKFGKEKRTRNLEGSLGDKYFYDFLADKPKLLDFPIKGPFIMSSDGIEDAEPIYLPETITLSEHSNTDNQLRDLVLALANSGKSAEEIISAVHQQHSSDKDNTTLILVKP